MDSILHYSSVGHAGSLMATVNQMRVCADLCDITVVVGDYRILAHKIILSASSPFFYQMLKTEARPEITNLKEILLDSVDEIAALKIIEFCYTSAISLDEDTVWPLLEAAIKFQFTEICSLCSEFLTAGLDISNCIPSLKLAAKLRFSQLEEHCCKFLADNFHKVSKSLDLVNSSAQDLSTILSILDAHKTPVQVIATLAQAWLKWDRKSRVDFIPKLKLLLPILSDLISNHFHAGTDVIPGQLSATDTNVANAKEEEKRLSEKSTDSLQVSDRNVKSPPTSSQLSGQESTRSPYSNGSSGQSASNPDSLSGDREQGDSSNIAKDFICVSCGDEFECNEDLTAHGRLCHESVRLLRTVEGENAKTLSTGSHFTKSNTDELLPSGSSNKSVGNDTEEIVGVNSLKSDESKPTSIESKPEVSIEPSYPKTRRSLRNRKLDITNIDTAEKKSTIAHGSDSLPGLGQSKGENDKSDSKLVEEKERCEEKDSTKQGENKVVKLDGDLSDGQQDERPDADQAVPGESTHQSDTAIPEEPLSVNDNNNNDVRHDSSSISQPTNVKKENSTVDTLGDDTAQTDTPFIHNTTASHEEKESLENFCEMSSREDNSVKSGFSPLQQWRQEHQNSSPANAFTQSSPNHKCLICSRGFWDRKALANHWRQNHGVSSVANEDEEFSCSDHEMDPKSSDISRQRRKSPKFSSQSDLSVAGYSGLKSDASMDMQRNMDAGPFIPNANRHVSEEFPAGQVGKRMLGIKKVKEELVDGKRDSIPMESFDKYKNYPDGNHLSQLKKAVEEDYPQTVFNQPPVENFKGDAAGALNPSSDHWGKGAIWSQENSENTAGGTDVSSASISSQHLNPATSEFFTNYLTQYKLAEWYMTQGAHYCSVCMTYHSMGKPCPKSVTENGNETSTAGNRGDYTAKDKDSKGVKVSKKENEEEGPLDMSKSSVDFSLGQVTPPSSKSSSVNSSGHSSVLGGPPFYNYGHLMSESDVLDMSTARFGEGKLMAHSAGNLALPLRKSPLDPNASFGTPFPPYQPQFSTATSLSSPSAGPSNSTTSPNTNVPMPSLPKSSTLARKKVTSRQGFPCTVCNRVFSYQTALFTHMHTHSPSARSYRCQLCNETFARAPDLKVHVCPNGMEKPYSCPSCGQTFAKNIHLKRHLATHSGLKPYPCWVCGKRFSRSDHLKRHTQSIHAGARPHVCQVCGKEFVRKYELNKHMQSHEQIFVVS